MPRKPRTTSIIRVILLLLHYYYGKKEGEERPFLPCASSCFLVGGTRNPISAFVAPHASHTTTNSSSDTTNTTNTNKRFTSRIHHQVVERSAMLGTPLQDASTEFTSVRTVLDMNKVLLSGTTENQRLLFNPPDAHQVRRRWPLLTATFKPEMYGRPMVG
jgi:hypothetical protein